MNSSARDLRFPSVVYPIQKVTFTSWLYSRFHILV